MAGGDEGVGIDEPAPLGVVVTALEVIQAGILDYLVAIRPDLCSIQRLKIQCKLATVTESTLNNLPAGGSLPPPGYTIGSIALTAIGTNSHG